MSKSNQKEKTRNKKVVVAMTGRVSSTVAAYLLKKQGLEPIGIGIEFFKPEKPFEYDAGLFPGVSKQAFYSQELDKPLRNHYHLSNIENVKEMADRLEISFYGVSAEESYYDQIQDPFIASRLAGRRFVTSAYVTKLIVEILQEKAKKLGADWIATGHFAKVLHSSDGKNSSVYVSNDLKEDQSHQFAYLKEQHLHNLILPLSEMRYSETLKIAELIGLKETKNMLLDADLEYPIDPRVPAFVNRYSPFTLRDEGDIYHYFNDIILGDHDGIQLFYPGKEKLSTRMTPIMDTSLSVVKIFPGFKRVVVADKTKIKYDHIFARKFNSSSDLDRSRPVSGYLRLDESDEKVSCTIFFKNNGYIMVRLAKKHKGVMYPGHVINFYTKKSIGGKLLGSAEVYISVENHRDNFRDLPPRDPELDDIQAEKEAENANPYESKYSDNRHHF